MPRAEDPEAAKKKQKLDFFVGLKRDKLLNKEQEKRVDKVLAAELAELEKLTA